MGKRIRGMSCAMLILVLAWMVASFIDVNMHNMADRDFQEWNVFSLFVRRHGAAGESSSIVSTVVTCNSDADTHESEKTPEPKRMLTEKDIPESQIKYLASVMHCENGDDERKALLTGIVVMKRVRHKKFPNSIKGVISQNDDGRYQYSTWRDGTIQNCRPSEMCMELAEEILRFNLAEDYPDGLIYQSEFPQGSGVYEQIGHEYFCIE